MSVKVMPPHSSIQCYHTHSTYIPRAMFPYTPANAACYDYTTERYGLQCLCGSMTVQTLQPVLSLPLNDYHRQQGGGHSDHPAGHVIQRVV